jgi:fructokinase
MGCRRRCWCPPVSSILAIGELLWDLLPTGEAIGGAPYNLAFHATRLGLEVDFVSAVGDDERGERAIVAIGPLSRHVSIVAGEPTGIARVTLGTDGQPAFEIVRPAAYDHASAVSVDHADWIVHGSLFAATEQGSASLQASIARFPKARRFFDVNLRPGQWNDALVLRLLDGAAAIKLSEVEMQEVARMAGLPNHPEDFCASAIERFQWSALAVTFGSKGCIVAVGNSIATCPAYPIHVADAVGAGDAFSAAFLYGVVNEWDASRTGDFANRLGAVVASRSGATPEWSPNDLDRLMLPAEPTPCSPPDGPTAVTAH